MFVVFRWFVKCFLGINIVKVWGEGIFLLISVLWRRRGRQVGPLQLCGGEARRSICTSRAGRPVMERLDGDTRTINHIHSSAATTAPVFFVTSFPNIMSLLTISKLPSLLVMVGLVGRLAENLCRCKVDIIKGNIVQIGSPPSRAAVWWGTDGD